MIDVLRAFTTAAYAFGAGAKHIFLTESVQDALALRDSIPTAVAMGENHGRRADGFDLSNSPVEAAQADLQDRVVVQRTSAGTRAVLAATRATRLWCASLVCASATASAVAASGLGPPCYVISGNFRDAPDITGDDDLAAAMLIERLRSGEAPDVAAAVTAVARSDEAARTLALGPGHVHPDDIEYATHVDRFDFAMEAIRHGPLVQVIKVRAT